MSGYSIFANDKRGLMHDIPLGFVVDPPWIAGNPFLFLPSNFFEMYIDDIKTSHYYHSGIPDVNKIEWYGEMAEFMEFRNLVFNKDLMISFMWQQREHSQYYWYAIRFVDDATAVEFKLRFGNGPSDN